MSCVSKNHGKTWIPIPVDKSVLPVVLVIVPGAGTYSNKKSYKFLDKHFDVHMINTSTREEGFRYPDGWQNNMNLSLPLSATTGLLGLANKIGQFILNKSVPNVIICGSRGSQVTVGLVWRYYWRGPTVCINAGPLTSHTKIFKQVFPVLVTMQDDYFKTQNDTQNKYLKNAAAEPNGLNVRLHGDAHMPNLDGRMNGMFLHRLVTLALGKRLWGAGNYRKDHYSIEYLKGEQRLNRAKKRKKACDFRVVTVHSQHPSTWLRKTNRSDRRNNFSQTVSNGRKVIVLDQATDEKGYAMLFVTTRGHKVVDGWIYAKNIKEHESNGRETSTKKRKRKGGQS